MCRNKNSFLRGLIWLLCFALNETVAQGLFVIDGTEPVAAGKYLKILDDKESKLTFSQVLVTDTGFMPAKAEVPNLDISQSSFWIKLSVRNTIREKKIVLQIEAPLLDYIEFYSPDEKGTYTLQKAGELFPFGMRQYTSQNFIFPLNIPFGTTYTYYFKIKSSEQIQVPVTIGGEKEILESNSTGDLLSGIYFGLIVVMIFYNLFIYVTVRDISYLYYVAYITFVGLTQACLHGYTFRYLWPNGTWLPVHSIFFIPALSGLSAIAFVNNFLQVRSYSSRLYKFSLVLAGIYVLGLILGFANVYAPSYRINDLVALLLSGYILWVAIALARKGHRPAKFFLIAWSFFLTSVIIFVMRGVGVLPMNNFTNYILEIGSAIEVTLLSLALADRINILRKEKEESQRRALDTLRENERIVSQQNIILEAKVIERTQELQTSNRNLKEAQVQLVNAEKMASLGQLTAGIAHEINNPINFVIGNINPLKRDVNDLLQVLNRYNFLKSGIEFEEKRGEIEALKKQLDTDYVVQEIDLLLKGIEEGAARTAEIVQGLKNFSRLDEDGLKFANIHSGIDATLLLLNSNLNQKKITVIKEYGNFPDIECYPGKLNQVFMNLLSNSMQAFDNKQEKKEIRISTERIGDQIRISIKDNGPGMDEHVKSRIFEPFFTTKNVGEGSGLGLSIVYGIIEKHHGKIWVESSPGVGAEFIITLPVNHE